MTQVTTQALHSKENKWLKRWVFRQSQKTHRDGADVVECTGWPKSYYQIILKKSY